MERRLTFRTGESRKLSPHLCQLLAVEAEESGSLPALWKLVSTSSGNKVHFMSLERLFRYK